MRKHLILLYLIFKHSNYNGCQWGLDSIANKFFDKNSSGSGVKSEIMPNQELAEESQTNY